MVNPALVLALLSAHYLSHRGLIVCMDFGREAGVFVSPGF